MIFVDTNYFLRFILRDVEDQYRIAKQLFTQAVQTKIKLFTSLLVIFEIYWVLRTFYGKEKNEIPRVLGKICQLDFIEFEGRMIFVEALSFYQKSNLDLVDSYNLILAKSKGITEFKTFDAKLARAFIG